MKEETPSNIKWNHTSSAHGAGDKREGSCAVSGNSTKECSDHIVRWKALPRRIFRTKIFLASRVGWIVLVTAMVAQCVEFETVMAELNLTQPVFSPALVTSFNFLPPFQSPHVVRKGHIRALVWFLLRKWPQDFGIVMPRSNGKRQKQFAKCNLRWTSL